MRTIKEISERMAQLEIYMQDMCYLSGLRHDTVLEKWLNDYVLEYNVLDWVIKNGKT